jgi:site-specific recombinase XerD
MSEKQEENEEPWADAGTRQYLERFSDEIVGHGFTLPTRLKRLNDMPLIPCYEQQLKAEKKSQHTARAYFIAVRQFLATTMPGEGELNNNDVANMSMIESVNHIDPNNGRLDIWLQSISHLKPATVNARLAAVSHLLKWLGHAVPDWVIRPQRSKRLPRTLTHQELAILLKACRQSENPLAEVVVVFFLETGLRVSELCALDCVDIDYTDLSANVWSGKGSKDRRVLFTKKSKEILEKWLRLRVSRVKNTETALFLNGRGHRLTQRNVQKMMDGLADDAGILRSRLTPHTLRHNFATGLLERGADIVSIQRLLGHADISSTRVYLDISDQTLREVYRRAQEADLFGDIE